MKNLLRKEFENVYFTHISSTKGIAGIAERIGISRNSLRRFLGKLNDGTNLSITTLNHIAESLGYANFKDFCDNSKNKSTSLDFSVLEIFYNSIKGKGVILGEERFQNVNYQFAEKILQNRENTKAFLKHFADNHEALEYVFAWHPHYGKIADDDYQDTLLKMAKITNNSHLIVFAHSFVYFGKFLSGNLKEEESENFIKFLRKNVAKMRKNYSFFWTFPEVRYRISECLNTVVCIGKETENYLLNIFVKDIGFYKYPNISASERFIYNTYFADMLNFVGYFQDANYLQEMIIEEKYQEDFENENYHSDTHILLFQVSRALTLYKLGKEKDSKMCFLKLSSELKRLPFDIKDYVEVQYYYLATKLFPTNEEFQRKFDNIVLKTNFTFFSHF